MDLVVSQETLETEDSQGQMDLMVSQAHQAQMETQA